MLFITSLKGPTNEGSQTSMVTHKDGVRAESAGVFPYSGAVRRGRDQVWQNLILAHIGKAKLCVPSLLFFFLPKVLKLRPLSSMSRQSEQRKPR